MIYGRDILYNVIRFTNKEVESVQSFNCGNEVINEYLKKEAYRDTQATTFLIVSNSDKQVLTKLFGIRRGRREEVHRLPSGRG